MMQKLIAAIAFLLIGEIYYVSGACSVADVTSFTTKDSQIVSQIAYIGEFNLNCDGGSYPQLFAEVEGKIKIVAKVGDSKSENRYQISWNEEIKKARSGDFNVRLFDEEGYANLKKAQRNGDDLSTVKSFTDIVVNHPGFERTVLINSEYLATAIAFLATYFAIYNRKQLTA